MEKTKNTTVPGPQNLMLENREKLLIQGVEQVESFAENSGDPGTGAAHRPH